MKRFLFALMLVAIASPCFGQGILRRAIGGGGRAAIGGRSAVVVRQRAVIVQRSAIVVAQPAVIAAQRTVIVAPQSYSQSYCQPAYSQPYIVAPVVQESGCASFFAR